MLILELYLMVKKKAEGSGRSSKAKENITDDRDVNLPRSIEEKRTEARD